MSARALTRSRLFEAVLRTVFRVRHPDRRQLAGPMQAGQRRRVPPIGLDPLAGLARDEARR
ncbi:hypothetical protein, partial [Roseomonas harenae]|uniref:hypothetical protein n=1 Tax=Muricoccus harenae TaxID=2692566 RepID=UPI001F162905